MANFTTNFSADEVNSRKLEGQKNPLSGKVEEVQGKFDALPLLVKDKLEALISELNKNLSNVENTADLDKPLSTDGLNKLAELKTEIEGYVDNKIKALVDDAPEAFDTLKEIAEALADNEDVVTEMNKMISQKASNDSVVTVNERVNSVIQSTNDALLQMRNFVNEQVGLVLEADY